MSEEYFCQALWIPAVMPGQNSINDSLKTVRLVKSRVSGSKTLWNRYAGMKKAWTAYIVELCQIQKLRFTNSAHFYYVISEPSRRRDPSNAVMGAVKIIEDALQHANVIPNDGWENVLSISATWEHNQAHPGVLVVLSSERITEQEATSIYWDKLEEKLETTWKLQELLAGLAKYQGKRPGRTCRSKKRFASFRR